MIIKKNYTYVYVKKDTHQIIYSSYSLDMVEVGGLALLYFKYVSFRSLHGEVTKPDSN